ncbi:MAG: hypothetical protein M1837_007240 [Sclerophora amabilis]|nr:MAG: hypothetical protein M1837_007240 [Sclerophora amabilis]
MLRRIAFWLSLLCLLADVVHPLAIDRQLRRRDADFASVRTKLDKDHSGKRGDRTLKYFHESTFHPHYDGRFAERVVPYDERRTHLTALIQSYLATMNDLGAVTWIMHGTLLGWWWNRKIMPWDSDIDVQISESTIQFLANYYNMTTYHYQTPELPDGKEYMLEINPRFTHREHDDTSNVIDARWIDTDTGMFIDITAIRKFDSNPDNGEVRAKDKHIYKVKDLFPLRDTYFENVPVKVPYAYTEVLKKEYGEKSLTKADFKDHLFNAETKEWEPKPKVSEEHKIPSPPKKEPAVKPKDPPPSS